MRKKLRVLLIAELADPNLTSVPLVGWSHAQALREIADIHIVTQIRHRQSFIDSGLIEGEDFTAIDSEAVASSMYKVGELISGGSNKGWTTKMAFSLPSYYYFEKCLWATFKRRIKGGEFDLVHRLTPLSPTLPSIITGKLKKSNVPFLWGPMAGGLPWPKEFSRERKKEKEWLSYVRNAYKLFPGFHSTRKNASGLVVASRATLEQLPHKYQHKAIYLPENAIDPNRFNLIKEHYSKKQLKLVFIGRLVPYKCADVVIRASKELLMAGHATLNIIGDGPERPFLERLAKELGLEAKINFLGNLPHTEVQSALIKSDILAFPSIREFGGGVVLEAMALGLLPIVTNYGGPAELVTKQTGITIPLGTKDQLVQSLKLQLEMLIANPDLIEKMGMAAKQRVLTKFTWQAKAEMMSQVYEWVVNPSQTKPHFGIPIN